MDQLRVLIVDDEEELVSTLVERLGLRDFQAEGVTRGERAIELIREKEYDVVVLDVKMPGMGGLEVFEKIRRERPTLPVILLTGHGSREDAEQGMEAGAFAYLMKPIKLEDLILIFHKAAGS